MSEKEIVDAPEVVAKMEEEAFLKNCEKCTKFFTTEAAFETHLKMKHCDKEEKEDEGEEDEEPEEEP